MKQCISTSALLTSFCIFIAVLFMMPISAQAAQTQTGTYVGYYESTPSKTSGGQQLFSLRVTPKTNYIFGSGPQDSSKTDVAYCFNKSKGWPRNSDEGWWQEDLSVGQIQVEGYTSYIQIANATGDQFADNAPNRSITNAEDFRAKILSIGLNGYPYDYSGFNKDANGNDILNPYVFRALTQYAIWYYTDNEQISDAEMDWRSWSDDEKRIYRLLVDTTLPKSITNIANSAIDLYLWDGSTAFDSTSTIHTTSGGTSITTTAGSYEDKYATVDPLTGSIKGYQNLLAVRTDARTTITQMVANTKTLTLSKTTTGSLNGNFTFNINLSAATYWVNEQTAENVKDDGNGHLTVTLKKGESISLKMADTTSFTYSIEETNASAYDTSISVVRGKGEVSATNPKVISGTNVTKDTIIRYTNTDTYESEHYPLYIDDDDDDGDDEDVPDNEYEKMDDEEKEEWREYMVSRYGTVIIDRYGYVWKNGDVVDTIPSKNGTPDFSKMTVKQSDTVAEEPDKSPKTADSNNPLFWLGLAVICAAVTVALKRRKMYN